MNKGMFSGIFVSKMKKIYFNKTENGFGMNLHLWNTKGNQASLLIPEEVS